ncbi:MAG: V-type ATPase subunit [Clostridia bacterium]|nr:V-type ATPase subunit [Clostridia bacterium]
MAKGYNPTEYMYSSARIRVLETRIATRERLRHIADADSSEAVMSQLGDFGFGASGTEATERESALEGALLNGYSEIESMECAGVVDFWRYQYDANNIKAVIKCASRGVDPESMLSALGTVSVERARDAFNTKDYSVFPKNIAAAIPEAEEAFAATSNPQKIDFIIDRACFADMLDSAQRSGIALAQKLVRAKIDLVNIMVTLRVLRMNLGVVAQGILDEAYIDGGSYDKDFFISALGDGEEELATRLLRGEYESLAAAMLDGATLGVLERRVDDILMGIAKEARYVSFGAEIAIGYIVALEYEVKNIRIILAGKDAGLSADVIRERLRDCYA